MIRLVKNVFWLLLGLALGIWVMRKLNRIARDYSPTGIAGRAQSTWGQFRDGMLAFGRDVKARADAREVELRAALAGQVTLPRPGAGAGADAGTGDAPAAGTDVDARPRDRHGD